MLLLLLLHFVGYFSRCGRWREPGEQPFPAWHSSWRSGWRGTRWRGRGRDDRRAQHPHRGAHIPGAPFEAGDHQGRSGLPAKQEVRQIPGAGGWVSMFYTTAIYITAHPHIHYFIAQVNYVVDFGTVYISGYDRLPFNMNKVDEYGNTMLSLACQNGNMKLCKYLISKGANPNHQNKNGQTPAHFAIAYKFFDLSTYLFENGGDDTLENRFGLSPYDGLSAEGGESEFPMLEN